MTISVPVAPLLQHFLFLFLLVLAPLWDYRDTRHLKQNPSFGRKLRYYKTLCAWLWITTAIAVLAVGPRALFIIRPSPVDAMWLFARAWVRYLLFTVITLFAALMLLPVAIAGWKKLTQQPRKYSSSETLMKSMGWFSR
jgi:hypothetical protein